MHRHAISRRYFGLVMFCLALAGCDTFTSTETRIARAEKSMATFDYRAALVEFKNVIQKDPDNARAHLGLAQVNLQLGDLPRAEKELKRAVELAGGKAISKGSQTPDPVELDTRIRLMKGKGEEVLADIDGGKLALTPALQALYRGQALLSIRRLPEAQAAFEGAFKADSGAIQSHLGLAHVHAAQGNRKQAIEGLEAATVQHPTSAELWILKAAILGGSGRNEETEQALEKAYANMNQLAITQQVRLLAALSAIRLKRNDIEGAEKFNQRLAKLSGNAPITRMLTARIAVARKDYPAAAAELQRLLNDTPDFVPARALLAEVLMAQGNRAQAELQLNQAIQKAPDNAVLRQILAKVRQQRGDIAAVGEDTSGQPQPQGGAPLAPEDRAKAIAAMEESLAKTPESPMILNNLAWLYHEASDARALETARKAYAIDPKSPEIADTYGWVLVKAGQIQEGLKLLEQATKSSKNLQIRRHYEEAQSLATTQKPVS